MIMRFINHLGIKRRPIKKYGKLPAKSFQRIQGDRSLNFFAGEGNHLCDCFTVLAGTDTEIVDQRFAVQLAEGFDNAGRHGVVKVWNTLASVHFILICLNGDTGKGRVAADVIRLAQIAVPC